MFVQRFLARPSRRDLMRISAFALAYFLAHRISFLFPAAQSVVMSVWPASGIALAGLLLLPRRQWPLMLFAILGAGVLDDVLFSGRRLPASVGFMAANLAEAALSAAVIRAIARRPVAFDRLREVGALFVAVLGVNAVTGCLGALAAATVTGESFIEAWTLWYISDGLGLLLIAPLIVTWTRVFETLPRWNIARWAEAAGFFAVWCAIAWVVFASTNEASHLALGPYLLIALLVWPAFRYGQHVVATLLVATAMLAVLHLGWFDPATPDGSFNPARLRDVQVFLGFAATSGYVMGAIYAEMRATASALRREEARYRSIARVLQYHPTSLREYLDFALAEAVALTRSVFGYIYHYDEATERFTLNTWSGQVMASCGVADPRTTYALATTGFWGEAVRQRQPILLNDFQAAHPLKKGYPAGHAPLHRFLSIPVIVDGKIVAVIGVANKEAPYDAYDIEQLQVFADATWKDVVQRTTVTALAESEARHAAVFYSTPVAMSVTRLSDGKILDVNDAAVHLFGHAREACLGRTSVELGIWPNAAEREEMAVRVGSHGRLDKLAVRLMTRDGEVALVELSGQVLDLHGDRCLVSTMIDVTERTRLAEVHLQAQKLESLGTLAGGIAHDFNNILAAIRGHAELATEDAADAGAVRGNAREILQASDRAADLVRRILGFARPQEAQRAVVNLEVIVAEVLSLLRPALPANVQFKSTVHRSAPHVLADAGQVHEALVNLTTNAAYAIGREPGVIEFLVAPVDLDAKQARLIHGLKAGRYTRLTVRDSGCGMDPGTLERVFDAFFTTKPVTEGTGLGLSMVHGTMTNHEGAVTVESGQGAGSSFHLWFPASEERAVVPGRGTADSRSHRTLHVMYVDDEASLVHLANRVLSRDGHRVSGFTEAREALAALHANPADYDVIVTDLSMPQMSGFDFAREVLSVRADVPVVLTTGFAREDDECVAREIGIREIMRKPVSFSLLGRELLRIADHAPEDALRIG